MTPELSRQVGRILGKTHTPPPFEERERIIAALSGAETWDDLPDDVRALLQRLERAPGFGPGKERRAHAAAPPPSVTDLDQLEAQHRAAVAEMSQQFQEQAGPLIEGLVAAVYARVGKSIAGLGNLAVKTAVVTAIADVIGVALLGLAALAAAQTATEVGIQAGSLPAASRRRITQLAQATVGIIAAGFASGAAREALRRSGTTNSVNLISAAIRVHLAELATAKPSGLVADALIAAATAAQGEGRRAVLEQLSAGWRFMATEELDRNTCKPCSDIDGKTYDSLAAALEDYPHGAGYHACEGRHRCRGQIEPIPPDGRPGRVG